MVRHVERRPPGAVTVLRELEVSSLAVEAGDDRAQPGPCVEPPVEQVQLGRAGSYLGEAERGAEGWPPSVGAHAAPTYRVTSRSAPSSSHVPRPRYSRVAASPRAADAAIVRFAPAPNCSRRAMHASHIGRRRRRRRVATRFLDGHRLSSTTALGPASTGPLSALSSSAFAIGQVSASLATPALTKMRDASEIRAELTEYLQNCRDMAGQGVAEARRLLRAVLVGRFVFAVTPPPGLPPRKGPGRKPRLIYELKGTLRPYRGVNLCKFSGGPNGTRSNFHDSSL